MFGFLSLRFDLNRNRKNRNRCLANHSFSSCAKERALDNPFALDRQKNHVSIVFIGSFQNLCRCRPVSDQCLHGYPFTIAFRDEQLESSAYFLHGQFLDLERHAELSRCQDGTTQRVHCQNLSM